MRCFYHSQIEAVGSCQACAKGLCRECAHALETGVVCKGYCEDKVRTFQDLAQTHARSLSGSGRSVLVSSLSIVFVGVLLILFGVRFPGPLLMIPLLGIACVVLGVSRFYRNRDAVKHPAPLRQAQTLELQRPQESVRETGTK